MGNQNTVWDIMWDTLAKEGCLSGTSNSRHPTDLVVRAVSTKKLSECPHCVRSCWRVHDRCQRQIRDLEMSGRRTVLLWTQRRFVCDECGKRHMEAYAQFLGGVTHRLARRLVQDAQVMSIPGGVPPSQDRVASDHGTGHQLVWAYRDAAVPSEMPSVADRRNLNQETPPLCDCGRKRRHRRSPGHGPRTFQSIAWAGSLWSGDPDDATISVRWSPTVPRLLPRSHRAVSSRRSSCP